MKNARQATGASRLSGTPFCPSHRLYRFHVPRRFLARRDALLGLVTVHTSGVVIADTFPYVSRFCRVRRATNSSFPISRMTHFDRRSAISVARTCLHWKQPGMLPVAPGKEMQRTGYVPSTETATPARRTRTPGRCRSVERSRSDPDSETRCRNLSCRGQKSDIGPMAKRT